MFNSLKENIISHDLFGQPIQLNYAKKDSEYKTFHGGLVSIVIKCILMVYIGSLLIQMITYDNNEIHSTMKLLNAEELLQETSLSNTSM